MKDPERKTDLTRRVSGVIYGLVLFLVGLAFVGWIEMFMFRGTTGMRIMLGFAVFAVAACGALASYVSFFITRSRRLALLVAAPAWLILISILVIIVSGVLISHSP